MASDIPDDSGPGPHDSSNDGSGGNGGTGEDNDDYDPTDPDIHGNGSGVGDDDNPIFAVDFDEEEEQPDPCTELKSFSDDPIIKTRLHQMKMQGAGAEVGLRVDINRNTGQYEPSGLLSNNNGERHINIPVEGNTVLVGHTHTDNEVFAMYAPNDIEKLISIVDEVYRDNTSPVNYLSITHILVTQDRTYAIRFDNMAAVTILNGIIRNEERKNQFKDRLVKLYNSDRNTQTFQLETNINKQLKHLFNLFLEFNTSLSIYEANYDANGLVDSWEKINKESLEKEPCN